MSQNQSAARTQPTRTARLKAWAARPALAALVAAGMIAGSTGAAVIATSLSAAPAAAAVAGPVVGNPGNQTSTVGTAVSLQIHGFVAGGGTLLYRATGLPAGLSINPYGLISGTPTTAGTSAVTVTATLIGAMGGGGASFTWTVSPMVANPGNQTSTAGTPVSLQITATGAAGQTLSYSATGLPEGLSIDPSTGLISGTPTTGGTSAVTVTATAGGASGSASFTWTTIIGCPGSSQLLRNPGFESGYTVNGWSSTVAVIGQWGDSEPAHSGTWDAWLGGDLTYPTSELAQTVTIPAGCAKTTFSFWLHIDTTEPTNGQYDTLKITANGTTIGTFSNLNSNVGYTQHSYSLGSFAGQTVTLEFTGTLGVGGGGVSSFVVDDTAINTG